ncbi:hypothetical protein FBQ80_09950 [Candidatus Brocadia sp. AMX2]|nr:hypothetical protein [Candidatus Brocadia sp. AMX2]
MEDAISSSVRNDISIDKPLCHNQTPSERDVVPVFRVSFLWSYDFTCHIFYEHFALTGFKNTCPPQAGRFDFSKYPNQRTGTCSVIGLSPTKS